MNRSLGHYAKLNEPDKHKYHRYRKQRQQSGGCQGGWWIDEGGQKMQASSYKINKSWGCNIQQGDYSQ